MTDPINTPLGDLIDDYRSRLRGDAPRPQDKFLLPMPEEEAVMMGNPNTHPGQPMGQDTVPAWLTPGEFVVNAEAMQNPHNAAVVEDINAQGQMMQDEQMLNRGGYVNYLQEGGEPVAAAPSILGRAQELAGSPAGAALGERLSLIGAGDLAGAAKVRASDYEEPESDTDKLVDTVEAAKKAMHYVDNGADVVILWKNKNASAKVGSIFSGDFSFSDVANVASGLFDEKTALGIVERAINEEFAGSKNLTAYRLFTQQLRILEVGTRALVKGGSISDAEAAAAAATILDPHSTPGAVRGSLNDVLERTNKALRKLGVDPNTLPAPQFQPITGEEYIAGNPDKVDEEDVDETGLAEGQKFTDEYDYEYTVGVNDDNQWTVTTSTGTYVLNYEEDTETFYIFGTDGSRYNLTKVEG